MNRWSNISPGLKKHLVLKVKGRELVFYKGKLFPRGVMFWEAFPFDQDLMAVVMQTGAGLLQVPHADGDSHSAVEVEERG